MNNDSIEDKILYIIAGCNGAGKTTASFTLLPEIFNCKEFINADEIAKGISPFNPESVNIEAGKIMLDRIDHFIRAGKTFAIETTLSSKNYKRWIDLAKERHYKIMCVFFWLDSVDLALQRVHRRVENGGHSIPNEVIVRRYSAGIKNFLSYYKGIVDYWYFVNNSSQPFELIAEGSSTHQIIYNPKEWIEINKNYGANGSK